jgi:hypothetical protein
MDCSQQGPWCAPNVRARILHREFPSIAGPERSEVAYRTSEGVMVSESSVVRELNDFFSQCAFLKQWTENGTVESKAGSKTQHVQPFDLYLVSIEPIVVLGIERQNPKASGLDRPDLVPYVWLFSPYLASPIEVKTSLAYHKGAKIVWFAPNVDHELHRVDLQNGAASFTVSGKTHFKLAPQGARLAATRI